MCPVFVSGSIWLCVCLWFGKPSSSAHQSLSLWEKRERWGDICEKTAENRIEWSWWKRRWNRCQKPFSHTMRQKQRHDGRRLKSVNSFFLTCFCISHSFDASFFQHCDQTSPAPNLRFRRLTSNSAFVSLANGELRGENAFHCQGHRLCLLQVCLR